MGVKGDESDALGTGILKRFLLNQFYPVGVQVLLDTVHVHKAEARHYSCALEIAVQSARAPCVSFVHAPRSAYLSFALKNAVQSAS
jgi:hypothetical protein